MQRPRHIQASDDFDNHLHETATYVGEAVGEDGAIKRSMMGRGVEDNKSSRFNPLD